MQPLSILQWYFAKIRKLNPENIWKHKRPQIAKTILSKKSNAGGITIPDFKLYYRAITNKKTWCWHKNSQDENWIKIEDLDINLLIYSQLIFDKGAQMQDGEKAAT
jgi:hypothetical protein